MGQSDSWSIPPGYRAAAVKAGIKPSGGLDLSVIVADHDCSAAGTFTLNRVCAAPVRWDKARVPSESVRAIVVNAGNANAATGAQGESNVLETAKHAAGLLNCQAEQVLIASTGVIGHQLPMDKVRDGVTRALEARTDAQSGFDLISHAIMTTDTKPKVFSESLTLGGTSASLFGVAKGAAMIGPKMATMLGFLITDACVAAKDLQPILSKAVEDSFNCISVEGHMSTNDTVLLLAKAPSGGKPIQGEDLKRFEEAVIRACQTLARMIPDDGEGATHLITIDVEGAKDREEARIIARAVADSPLVKTAIHGADPNWGRIVSAAGYSGVEFDENEVSLWLNDTPLYKDGVPLAFDAAKVSAHLRENRETFIRLTLKRGDGSVRFWTCDLTAEYIHLNADYTT
ncbi:bifunctional glutamate N-acetyltransferase/amino-acid acetyltransferase ArgJ [Singulisphaera sp. PoT]|uniref:bifunctional glutamate N-acetyltransferase/amino-acid acetyltransferase ArgJ n=1 Tax=Singulisphaera sp. PoT TaxID=3411797 RepID=UPI003BF5693F